MRVKRVIQRHLTFSRSERWVVLYLVVVILIIALSQNYFTDLFTRKAKSELVAEHKALADKMQKYASINISGSYPDEEGELNDNELFYFNPNTISQSDWIRLGVSEKTAGTILNYISHGGKFNNKSDLLKIYGFSEKDFERLFPYIQFDVQTENTEVAETEILLRLFNPNIISADEWISFGIHPSVANRIVNYIAKGGSFKKPDDLMKIYDFTDAYLALLTPYMIFESEELTELDAINRFDNQLSTKEINLLTYDDIIFLGFSSSVAKNFINFRNKLGGYYTKDQLYELYEIDKEKAIEVFSTMTIDTLLIKKISINKASEEELKNHPYISDKLAVEIINYRNSTGKFYSIYEIQKAGYISKNTIEKLEPYLEL